MESIEVRQLFTDSELTGFTVTQAPCHAEISALMWDELGGALGAEWIDRCTVRLGTVPGERVTYKLIGQSVYERSYIVEKIEDERNDPVPDVPEADPGDAYPRT